MKIALADDQALVRHGLRMVLENLGGFEVAVEADDGEVLLAELHRHRVDVILSDIRMPRRSGIDVARALRERGDFTPVLLLTTFDDPALLSAAVAAGATGYMLKDATPGVLRGALERVARGETLLAPMSLPSEVPMVDAPGRTRLTSRELSILRLIANGYSNKEIGRLLHISDGTVKNVITDILRKLGARDRTHAVLKAIAARQL